VRVLGIEKASFTEDFSFVEVQLRTDQSQGLTLEFSTNVLQEALVKLAAVFHSVQTDALAKGNKLDVYSANVADANVQASKGTGVVGLGLSTEDGLTQYFALPVDLSAKLRQNLIKAEEIALSQSSQTRQ
jgi:hypothetical protein